MLRGDDGSHDLGAIRQLRLPEMDVASFLIKSGTTGGSDWNLAAMKPRERFGVNVLAIRRDGRWLTGLDGETRTRNEDLMVVLGASEDLARFGEWLESPAPAV